jgi:hypothetical protein
MQLLIEEKLCHTCHIEKPLTNFYRDRYKKDGYVTRCKQCLANKNSKRCVWIKCKCNCGLSRPDIDKYGHKKEYIKGHQNRRKTLLNGKNHHCWKGGRHLSASGYILIHCPNHRLAGKNGYALEHRLVYEKFHKCCLLHWSHVHHKDGNKQNNDISNLEGMTDKMHCNMHHPVELEYGDSCKYCGSEHIVRWRVSDDKLRFRCINCNQRWTIPTSLVPPKRLAKKKFHITTRLKMSLAKLKRRVDFG